MHLWRLVIPVGGKYVIFDCVLVRHYFFLPRIHYLFHLSCVLSLGIVCHSVLESLVTWGVVSFLLLCFRIAGFVPELSGTCSSVSQLKWPAPLQLFVPPDPTCLARTHKCRRLALPSHKIFTSTLDLCTTCSDYCFVMTYAYLLIRFVSAVYTFHF